MAEHETLASLATGEALLEVWRLQQRHDYILMALQERCNAQEVELRTLREYVTPLRAEAQLRQAKAAKRPVYIVALISAGASIFVTFLAWVLKK